MHKRNGFSLVELVVVLAIIGIVLTIASLNFGSMQRKYNIEKVTSELFSTISDLRVKAMTRKESHSITLNANEYLLSRGTTQFARHSVPYVLANQSLVPFSGTVITFDERGFTGGGSLFGQTIVIGPTDVDTAINCVVISNARVNMGKLNGTVCEFK